MVVGTWETHPCHADKLTLQVSPKGVVTLRGCKPKYANNHLLSFIPLLNKKRTEVDASFTIENCEFEKGMIRYSMGCETEALVLADDHVIFGKYHLYKILR